MHAGVREEGRIGFVAKHIKSALGRLGHTGPGKMLGMIPSRAAMPPLPPLVLGAKEH